MSRYQHLHHAGNCGDVIKHDVLVNTLRLIKDSEKQPLHFIETHAGDGRYSLVEAAASGHCEWQHGIARVLDDIRAGRLEDCHYARLVREINQTGIHTYPGSPWFAARLLGQADVISLCELEEKSATRLTRTMTGDRRASIYRENGFAVCPQLVKPDHHNIVLIDPPYQSGADETRVIDLLHKLATFGDLCTIMVWVPTTKSAVADEAGILIAGRGCSAAMLVSGKYQAQAFVNL